MNDQPDTRPAPTGIQLSRVSGFSVHQVSHQLNDRPVMNVARPSQWGNPYRIKDTTTKSPGEAVELFRACLERWQREEPAKLEEYIAPLRGKNLACWCPIGTICHRDVLLEFAAAPPWTPALDARPRRLARSPPHRDRPKDRRRDPPALFPQSRLEERSMVCLPSQPDQQRREAGEQRQPPGTLLAGRRRPIHRRKGPTRAQPPTHPLDAPPTPPNRMSKEHTERCPHCRKKIPIWSIQCPKCGQGIPGNR